MKTIEQKLASIKTAAAAAGVSLDQARHLIHAVGGSPRRARRLLQTDIGLATLLAGQFKVAIDSGTPYRTLLAEGQARWNKLFPTPEGGEGEDEATEEETADDIL
jgi:hypothetical protein